MRHAPVLDKLARVGYATKGALYLVIGGLAVLYAIGEGGALIGNRDAPWCRGPFPGSTGDATQIRVSSERTPGAVDSQRRDTT